MSLHPFFTDEYLDIDGFILGTHNIWVESLAPLFTRIRRGATETLPYVEGGVSYRKRRTFHSVTLTVNVLGDVDDDGAPIADAREGLYDALDLIESSLLDDVDGTRTATWHRPNGDRTAEVDVISWTVTGNTEISAVGLLELSIVAGWWESGGS